METEYGSIEDVKEQGQGCLRATIITVVALLFLSGTAYLFVVFLTSSK